MKKILLLFGIFASSLGFAQAPAYYNGINFAASGTSIYSQLATLITNTHNEITYSECWDALKEADLDEGSTTLVALVYGYDDTDGSVVNDRTRDKNMNGGVNGEWNREHVFPKSLGNPDLGTSGPGSDAHNLRASDVQQNGNRANKLFTDGTGDAGTVSSSWYPGDEWKGDCARIVMYMYMRYGTRCVPADAGTGTVNSTDANMANLFLDWNFEDPVSQFEMDRNDAIENHQGNRNPFIDNPRIAYQIWGGPLAEDTWGGLGAEENKNEMLTIYPNPIKDDFFYVSGLHTTNLDSIKLYSATGQLINVFDLNELINNGGSAVDHIQDGTYILSIIYDEQVIQRKIIIQ
jgi:endonuclease I